MAEGRPGPMKFRGSGWPVATVAECVEAARAGDQRAYAELFDRYRRFAWGVARSVTRSHQAAEEATVDGFASAFRGLGNLHDPARFPSYLATCVRNEVLQGARRRTPAVVAVDRIEEIGDIGSVSLDTPESRLVRSEEGNRALAAFRRLDDRQREAILLVDVEGVPPAEVAATFGITANALHQLLHRARESLRHRYVAPPIGEGAPPACRTCNDKLGIYLAGRASVRVISMVDRHTSTCTECMARLADAREVNDTVRAAYGVAPVGLAALLLARHGLAVGGPTRAPGRWMHGPGGRHPGGHGAPGQLQGAHRHALVRLVSFRLAPARASLLRLVSPVARLPQRAIRVATGPVGIGPLSSLPVGATLGFVSATMTTLAALAASVPLAAPSTSAGPAAAAAVAVSSGPAAGTMATQPRPGGTAPPGGGNQAGGNAAAGTAGSTGSGAPRSGTAASGTTTVPSGPGGGVPRSRTSPSAPTSVQTSQPGSASSSTSSPPSTSVSTSSSTPPPAPPPPSTGASSAAVTSGASATFVVGQQGTFVVRGAGLPAPTLTESGSLPPGVTFTDDHDGTAVLSGTPGPGAGGVHPFTVVASNGVGPPASQAFTLTVDQAPAFVPAAGVTLYAGGRATIDVHATGYPVPALTESGAIAGMAFADAGGGTGILSGQPSASAAGVHVLVFTASNGVGPPITMTLQVTVVAPDWDGGRH